ncbi:MAG: hypothetical protein WBB62_06095 [Rhodococcus sp. (in: high G+C Gram-positive bacteria)]
MKVTAKVQRSGQWWAVQVPEVDGAFTQARKLDEVADMVRDAVSLLEDVPVRDIDVDVQFDLGDDLGARIAHARQAVTEAALAQESAARLSRDVVAALREDGLTVADVGTVLGISAQRVSQLARTRKTTTGVQTESTASAKVS